jgi:glucokinase
MALSAFALTSKTLLTLHFFMPPHRSEYILAGDIGGTKCIIALFSIDHNKTGKHLVLLRTRRYPSASFPRLNTILRGFLLRETFPIQAACFGVPGPVHRDEVKLSNLPWSIHSQEIAEEFSIPSVHLINDLAANAHGITELKLSDFLTIQEGNLELGASNRCVISPGTGLGEAGIYWDGKRHQVWACEGGHADFSPRSDLEIALLRYLTRQFGHVSYERIISGQGIQNIFNFLQSTGRIEPSPRVVEEMAEQHVAFQDAAYVVSKYAHAGTCPVCVQTMEIFVGCLGAEAGNLALKVMATGGVYLGGGIPIRNAEYIKSSVFLHAFADKGRMGSLMKAMPIKIILNDQTALLGAARYALESMS